MITAYKLFTAPTCPTCPMVKAYVLSSVELPGEVVEVSPHNQMGFALARQLRITSVPQVIFFDELGNECGRAKSVAEIDVVLSHKEELALAS